MSFDDNNLSEREFEIIELACSGLSRNEMGNKLGISPKTVANHLFNIYKKLKIDNVVELTNWMWINHWSDMTSEEVEAMLKDLRS